MNNSDAAAPPRRRLLAAGGACLALGLPRPGRAHGIGIVRPPVPLPATVAVRRSDGARMPLGRLLEGRTTLLQLMFTGCSEVCPLQGALFASLQDELATLRADQFQLLSLSIDPMDDARSLSGWLRRFGAGRRWLAAVPSSGDIDVVRAALQSGTPGPRTHTSQVYFVDRYARLVWRSEDFPPNHVVLDIARQLL
jgi:protein SCO1/2